MNRNKLLILWVVFILVVPLALLLIGYILLSLLAFSREDSSILDIPKPVAKAGYEIIYTRKINGYRPDEGTFYYLSNKRQVIYRYDADRYLELQGENCNGLIWYHDTKKNIHTRIEQTFFTAYWLPKYPYFNPGQHYIGIPTDDLSEIVYSIDGGRTFISSASVDAYAVVPPSYVERYIGVDDQSLIYPGELVYEKEPVTISGNTGYFILNNGDIIFGASHNYDQMIAWNKDKAPTMFLHYRAKQRYYSLNKIFDKYNEDNLQVYGQYWRLFQENPDYLAHIGKARDIVIEPYQGWDRIRCEVGAEK